MALIGTIRKNGWILIAMMTLALGGFILMEIISNAQRNSAGDANTLGKVNGLEIKRMDFERYQALIYSNADASSSFQVREQSFNFFVERFLVNAEAEKLGLGVGRDELRDLEFSVNPGNLSPIIRERYKGDGGQVNMNYLNSVKNAIDNGNFQDQPQYPFRSAWIEQEQEIIKQRLEDKMVAMVSKGFYTPTWQAEMVYKESSERVDFARVRIPFDKIKDDEAPVTDADYQAFLKDNPKLYDQTEETRTIAYVSFDVIPTTEDTLFAKEQVAKLMPEFRSTKEDSTWVTTRNGEFDNDYKAKAALPVIAADSLLGRPIGTVFGPYLEGNTWKVAKVIDRKVIPDSVRARHILLKSPDGQKTLDSLKNLIATGKSRFDSLAVKLSQDPGSGSKGGDLGWFANGMMVQEFNNVCFYTGEQGKMYIVQTQFGWHMIEITGKKFIKNETGVRAAYLKQRVEPSKNTQLMVKEKALALLQQCKSLGDLTAKAAQQNMVVTDSRPLKENDYTIDALGSGNDAREIVRWAYDDKAKVNTLSKDIFSFRDADGGYFDAKYVLTGLKSITPKGKASVATLKATPDADQKVKNLKKGEVIKSRIQNTELSALADQWQVRIDTARNASMMQGGSEPRVVGVLFTLPKDGVSQPIIGNSGVFVVKPLTDKPPYSKPADLSMFRRQVSSSTASNFRINFMATMKKKAKIRDNRSRFF